MRDMDGAKSPFRSVTVLSAATSALLSLLGVLGVNLDPQVAGDALDGICQLASAILAIAAVYGRLRATTRIGRNA